MINRVLVVLAIVFVGLLMLPCLLWRAWDNTILKKEKRGLDLDYRASKSAGEL